MQIRKQRRYIVFLTTLVILILSSTILLQPVLAGSNGQQIQVQLTTYPDQIVHLIVKGTNQYNNYVVYDRWPYANPAGTAGWWWKGLVGITTTSNLTGITSNCIAQSIPTSQGSNWVTVTINPTANTCTCNASGCACWCR